MSAPLSELTSWHAAWKDLRVAVLGLGVTGFSVADTLTELGADVMILAESASADYERLAPVIGAQVRLGSLEGAPSVLSDFDAQVVVASPGFSSHHPVIRWVQDAGIPLWGDIELAWRVRDKVPRAEGTPAEWIFVTGASGATETAVLAASMLLEGGVRVAPCGNNSVPILDAIRDPAGFDALVVELSAAQLWYLAQSAHPISPYASVCVATRGDDRAANGFDRSNDALRAHAYENTRIACIYNKADAATMRMVEGADVVDGARAIGFDLGVPGPSDLGVVEGILVDRAFHAERRSSALELATVHDLASQGLDTPHGLSWVLASSALARSMGVSPEAISRILQRDPGA